MEDILKLTSEELQNMPNDKLFAINNKICDKFEENKPKIEAIMPIIAEQELLGAKNYEIIMILGTRKYAE